MRLATMLGVWGVLVSARAAGAEPQALDFSGLSDAASRELAQVLGEEFCGCGAPHTLGVCVQSHPGCRHSRRLAQIAASLAQRGATAAELGVLLARYNLSFREKRAKLPIDDRMCTGDSKVAVTLAEFADFECPICGVTRPILEKFVQERPGKVRLCYLPFPLAPHPNAIPAGQAALFARDAGKFWPVHDALFENQKRLSPDVIREIVNKAGLSGDAWAKAAAKGAYTEELERSRAAGVAAGVQGTPTVYLNGRKLDFLPQPELLQLALEDEQDFEAHRQTWTADEAAK
jgi:protein-disulfide isomerase